MTLETANPRRWAAARLLPGLILALLFMAAGYRLPVADAADLPVATAARVAGDETRTRFVADTILVTVANNGAEHGGER